MAKSHTKNKEARIRGAELLELELRRLGLVGEIKYAGLFQGMPVMDYIRDEDGEPVLFDVKNKNTGKMAMQKKLWPVMQTTKPVAGLKYLHQCHSPNYKGEKVQVTGAQEKPLPGCRPVDHCLPLLRLCDDIVLAAVCRISYSLVTFLCSWGSFTNAFGLHIPDNEVGPLRLAAKLCSRRSARLPSSVWLGSAIAESPLDTRSTTDDSL